MSIHHQLTLQRYGLGVAFAMPGAVNPDPIFTPLFTAIFSSSVIGLSGTALTAATTIASALATTGLTQEVHYLDRN